MAARKARTCIGYDTEKGHVDCGGPLMTASPRTKRCPKCGIKQDKFSVARAWQRRVERIKAMGG